MPATPVDSSLLSNPLRVQEESWVRIPSPHPPMGSLRTGDGREGRETTWNRGSPLSPEFVAKPVCPESCQNFSPGRKYFGYSSDFHREQLRHRFHYQGPSDLCADLWRKNRWDNFLSVLHLYRCLNPNP